MVDFSRLKTWLLAADLQKKNNPLYQLLEQLIEFVRKGQSDTNVEIINNSSGISGIKNADLLTYSDELSNLPNSRELLAGTNITFDDTVPGARTVNSTATVDGYWTLLTDGDPTEPELIFSDEGDVISEFIPT